MTSRTPERSSISEYYDSVALDRVREYVETNPRVEYVKRTLSRWGPQGPDRILDIGCGIGDMVWWMSERWPEATITGVDLSSTNVEIARKLFDAPNVTFERTAIQDLRSLDAADLIVLVDVYEHVPPGDRQALHRFIGRTLADDGRVFLSFPTPRHQAYLRTNDPNGLQPVDEDIGPEEVSRLASETETDLLLYELMSVWNPGDYAHVVLQRAADRSAEPSSRPKGTSSSTLQRVQQKLSPRRARARRARRERERRVASKLGIDLANPGR